jgi:hypothetical protein
MQKFRLKGLRSPGQVNIYNPETQRSENIQLESIDDDRAQKLFDQGCPFIELVPEAKKPSTTKE